MTKRIPRAARIHRNLTGDPLGTANHRAKLTEQQVKQMRRAIANGMSINKACLTYAPNVNPKTAYLAATCQTWPHLK